MKNSKLNCFKRVIAILLLISCSALFSESSFSQQTDSWKDKSDELPGTDLTWMYVTLGVVAAGLAVLFIVNSGPDEPADKLGKSKDQSTYQAQKDSTTIEKTDTTITVKNEKKVDDTIERKRD